MAYFKNLDKQLEHLLTLFSRDERWLITIIADPDAVSSALSLRRIMLKRVRSVTIASPTTMTRPDNLAMLRLLHISLDQFTPAMVQEYDRFAIVDAQPDHNDLFKDINYSIIIDHHPEKEEISFEKGKLIDIRPTYGATATIMTEYLYNLDIKPSPKIATALQLGIRTDTGLFERSGSEVDMRAFQYLAKFANSELRSHILKSEYKVTWLPYFSLAFENSTPIGEQSCEVFTYVDTVPSPDILVAIADFCMRVREIQWVAVAGKCDDKVIIIFRGGDLDRDLGRLATIAFNDIGSAGGHRNMARAEVPLKNIPTEDSRQFILQEIANALNESIDETEDDDSFS
ncbi:MAG: DHH family phosphoesterase [Desulfovibrionaceae bacterium]